MRSYICPACGKGHGPVLGFHGPRRRELLCGLHADLQIAAARHRRLLALARAAKAARVDLVTVRVDDLGRILQILEDFVDLDG